jgi:hypothetical protein
MPANIVLGLTALAVPVFYIFLVWRASWYVASLLASPFSKPDDDEIDRYVGSGHPQAGYSFIPITRGDRRAQLVFSLVILPGLIYLHYQFWDPLAEMMKWLFEDVLAPFIIETFYSTAALSASGIPGLA